MAIIDDIKCPRCDRKYSGVRSRCPYCGARRIGFGKYTKDGDNARGKMMISVLILSVFTVAAAILLFSTPRAPVEETPDPASLLDDTLALESLATPEPTPVPVETPPPPPELESIAILNGGSPSPWKGDDGIQEWTIKITDGTYRTFSVKTEPVGIEADIKVESSDDEVCYVERLYDAGFLNGFSITPVSRGVAVITATAGDLTARARIRVS